MAHIFISYAHSDGNFVELLIEKLKEAGFTAWVDSEELRAGKDWVQAIDEAIQNSLVLVLVMSPDAKKSEYVTYEWAYALGVDIRVIPLMLHDTELHPRLKTLQYIRVDNHFNLTLFLQKLIKELKLVEKEFDSAPKSKSSGDLPIYVQNAIDLLNHSQYFYTSEEGLLGNLRGAINTLSSK